jgi:small ligand-binding sensory domain FIST
MRRFLHGHAAHADWRTALAQATAQIEAQAREPGTATTPTLGWVYVTDHYADAAPALVAELKRRWPDVAWTGSCGVGVSASGVEAFDQPALSLLLGELPRDQFRIYSGTAPLARWPAATAQVHADPATADLAELVHDLSARTSTGYLFGGLAAARGAALHVADEVLHGGLSGVAYADGVDLVSRVTQGCQPVGPLRTVTEAEGNVVVTLDGEPALGCLLRDLAIEHADPRAAIARLRQTLVGLSDAADALADGAGGRARRGAFGTETRVRHLIGLDSSRKAVAIADVVAPGMRLAFCGRDVEAARRDLMRICAEIREETEPETLPIAEATGAPAPVPGEAAAHGIAGAIYVSCAGRGGPHFGAPSAELAIVRRALGDVPLAGFFAAGEIARHHVYGYTGVLTVFRSA